MSTAIASTGMAVAFPHPADWMSLLMHHSALRLRACSSPLALASVLVVGLFLLRCGGTQSTQAPSEPTADDTTAAGPAFSFLLDDANGLILHDARSASSRVLVPDARFSGASRVSPNGRYLAFSYRADSSHLALLDLTDGRLQPVHAHADSVVYSLAWHPTADTLAYGFYTPATEGTRGPGDVRVATPQGPARRVGCSAAREVLHWLPDGSLAARDDDNLYLVAASNCTTRARLDVRQKHRLAYSADSRFLTYVLQDLRYVREEREYVPDSTLFISDARGKDATKLFGDARTVRHLQWAPDEPELAFDLLPEDNPSRRQIVVYDAAQEQTSYLVPPTAGGDAEQVQPQWSPEGSYIAFVQRRGSTHTAAVRIAGRTQTLGTTTGPVQWVTERRVAVPGPDSLYVKTVRGADVYALPASVTLIHAWSRASV